MFSRFSAENTVLVFLLLLTQITTNLATHNSTNLSPCSSGGQRLSPRGLKSRGVRAGPSQGPSRFGVLGLPAFLGSSPPTPISASIRHCLPLSSTFLLPSSKDPRDHTYSPPVPLKYSRIWDNLSTSKSLTQKQLGSSFHHGKSHTPRPHN